MLQKFERYRSPLGPRPSRARPPLPASGGQGGNKPRKLEYIIPDAIASNADKLVSIGGVQSNHTRMVAAVVGKIGMKCLLGQESGVPHEDTVYDRVGNILLSRIMGAEVRGRGLSSEIWRAWVRRVRGGGARPGETAWVCLRLHCRLHGHGLDARRHARGFAKDGRQPNLLGIELLPPPPKPGRRC